MGQIVYHRWRCVSDLVNKFCITIHSCVIEDGKGDRLQLLDTQGCAVDKSLMDNPDYTDDLTAVRSTQVFTYADRVAVYFQCQIDLFVKEQLKCPRPTCLISRKSRSAERLSQHHKLGVMDVNSELNAFDHFNPDSDEFAKDSDDICLSAGLFWNVSVVVMLVTMVAFINFWLLVTKLRCSITSARVKLV